jgi:hypothetical protein
MPDSLASYRDWVLKDEGGQLGVTEGFVDLNPDTMDRDAARSIISAKLFDTEYLSGAYGGSYFWIPRWSDSRRAEERGYRVRYVAIFEPPEEGSYRVQAFGYGETRSIPRSASAASLQTELRQIHEDLADIDVVTHAGGFLIHLPQRLGLGSTAGRFIAQGGVATVLLNRDLTQALRQGDKWIMSPRIPFETMDNIQGLHDCINMALADIVIPDMLPVVSSLPRSRRSSIVAMSDIASWLNHKQITGFYAPTDWISVSRFVPPASGNYTFTAQTALEWGPTVASLSYSSSGAQIEAALSAIVGSNKIAVEPQGVASSYQIGWRTMHHEARLYPSAGAITEYKSERLRDPFPITINPYHRTDFEASSLSDPGYPEDQTWFVEVRRRAHQRICPQTWPRKADGSLNRSAPPILGNEWVESSAGLVNDLDQALPTAQEVRPGALRYAFLALAASSPQGEEARWLELARRAGVQTAAQVIYGRMESQGSRQGTLAGLPKSLPFYMPGD